MAATLVVFKSVVFCRGKRIFLLTGEQGGGKFSAGSERVKAAFCRGFPLVNKDVAAQPTSFL
jgi:hypothetical protein